MGLNQKRTLVSCSPRDEAAIKQGQIRTYATSDLQEGQRLRMLHERDTNASEAKAGREKCTDTYYIFSYNTYDHYYSHRPDTSNAETRKEQNIKNISTEF